MDSQIWDFILFLFAFDNRGPRIFSLALVLDFDSLVYCVFCILLSGLLNLTIYESRENVLSASVPWIPEIGRVIFPSMVMHLVNAQTNVLKNNSFFSQCHFNH